MIYLFFIVSVIIVNKRAILQGNAIKLISILISSLCFKAKFFLVLRKVQQREEQFKTESLVNIKYFSYLFQSQSIINQSYFVKNNKNLKIQLKEKIENLNSQIFKMFNSHIDLQDSEFSSSEDLENDNKEDYSSDSQILSEEQNQIKNVQKSCKSIKFSKRKTLANYQNNNEKEIQSSQEFRVYPQNSNLVYENQDIKMANSKITSTHAKSQSDDNCNGTNGNLDLNSNTSQTNYQQLDQLNKCVEKNDSVLIINTIELNNHFQNINESEEAKQQMVVKKNLLKHIQPQLNQYQNTNQEQERSKQTNRKSFHNSNSAFQNGKSYNRISSREDQIQGNYQEYQNQQIQQGVDNQIYNTFKNSAQQLYLDKFDKNTRCSIEQIVLQAVLSNTFIQFNRPSNQQIKANYDQANPSEQLSRESSLSSVDLHKIDQLNQNNKESSSKYINTKSCSFINDPQNKNINTRDSQRNLQNQYNKMEQLDSQQIAQRVSHLVQSSNIPLLLQLTSGMSFRNPDTSNPHLSMHFFDKMQNFKKFFTNNNFDKVIAYLKTIQQEQKRQKKQKIAQKARRQNIAFRIQTFYSLQSGKVIFQKNLALDNNLNQYNKPSHLLYGVGFKEANNIPIRQFNQNFQDKKQNNQ
ncbi:hypothetical protein ABPG72_001489 [Tetrahymena utriculariae]